MSTVPPNSPNMYTLVSDSTTSPTLNCTPYIHQVSHTLILQMYTLNNRPNPLKTALFYYKNLKILSQRLGAKGYHTPKTIPQETEQDIETTECTPKAQKRKRGKNTMK